MKFLRVVAAIMMLAPILLRSHLSSAFSTSYYSLIPNTIVNRDPVTSSKEILPSTAFAVSVNTKITQIASSTTTTLFSTNRRSGLARQMEGATPAEGGMTLYLKAGPDGQSVGDCPFAQYIRLILNEKKLPHTPRPCTKDTKPAWLIDHYEGKMPALRHRSECYVDSDVIAEYLEFFFQDIPLTPSTSKHKKEFQQMKEQMGSVFPAIAKYLKYSQDGDEQDSILKTNLREVLTALEANLTPSKENERNGSFLVGDGQMLTLLDCSLAPKLFHMKVGLTHFKQTVPEPIDLESEFPALTTYMNTMFVRDSFQDSLYPEETVVWGWSNARA